jgi:3-methylfumaryl-CoA hydratase
MTGPFSAWLGRRIEHKDVLEAARTNALRAAVGQAAPLADGAPLPLLHHWLYFWDVRPPEQLGHDGHPARGGFLPPVPLPRRMWAGGRLKFLKDLHLGERVTRTSTISRVEEKSGRSGPLVFVTVSHELAGSEGLALVEEQDLVYRDAAAQGTSTELRGEHQIPTAEWRQDVFPDPVLLFRYSALTLNGHRIHYDRPYAVEEESYSGLVVHGPLQATLLIDLAARNLPSPITRFEFRGQSPAFDSAMLHICGEPTAAGGSLWTAQRGRRNMIATASCGAAV